MPPTKPPPAPETPLHVEWARIIGERGWMALGVIPTQEHPVESFTYTMGLWRSYDHPELVIVGMNPQNSHGIFSEAVARIQGGARFEGGVEYDDLLQGVAGRPYPTAFRQVSASIRDEKMSGARRWNAYEDFPALQLVYPDPRGLFPWDDGYDRNFIQPLLSIEENSDG